jgi:Ser/Thr protein kinase RdoA (MazF antagonist)
MDKEIKARFHEGILREAMQRFGIDPGDIRLLDGFESFLYEFQRLGEHYVLRIGHSRRRSAALIQGEVDWIITLRSGGARVAGAVYSIQGRLVEAIDDRQGGQFLATAFEKAPGKPPWEVGWTPQGYQRYGELLGRMHALSRLYQPTHPRAYRPQWDDPLMLDVKANLPASEQVAVERFQACVETVRGLPKTPDWYGLIHFDAHAGNLFMDEKGELTLFDFDDCHYNWYANDIAIVWFYFLMGRDDQPDFLGEFLREFLRGYRRENDFNLEWLTLMPLFMKMREIDLYAVIHRSFDVHNLDDPWCARYMQGRKQRIEDGLPYLEVDFEAMVS